MRSRGARIAVFVAFAAATPSALAQVVVVPTATPFPAPASPTPGGDLGYVPPFSGFRLSAPMRLSLMGAVAPVAGGFPNCATLENENGNSVGGIPVQHYLEWRMTPQLVLSTFTQLGCPIDGGVGAAATYAVPLDASSHLSLVFAAGGYVAPGQFQLFGGSARSLALGFQGARSPAPVSLRSDLVWGTPDRPLHVGVQALGTGRRLVTFGGGF